MLHALKRLLFGDTPTLPEARTVEGLPRSSRWDSVRRKHLLAQPSCQACGNTKNLSVHHIEPFHLRPDRELDFSNLISLCEDGPNCHFTFGHLRDWRQYNPQVVGDAALYLSRLKQYRIQR